MNTGEYRSEYAAFCAALAQSDDESFRGVEAASRRREMRERFADLWTRTAVGEREQAATTPHAPSETEQSALNSLLELARAGFVAERTREVAEELRHCETAASFAWRDGQLSVAEAPARIADEPDPAHRRELAARWFDALSPCDDLRAALVAARHDARCELDDAPMPVVANDSLMHAPPLPHAPDDALTPNTTGARADADEDQIYRLASLVLALTDSTYAAHLARWAAPHLLPAAREPSYADGLRLTRLPQLEFRFSQAELTKTYRAALGGFGVHIERQANLKVEAVEQRGESTWARAAVMPQAVCLAPDAPVDVRLLYRAHAGGAPVYRDFFAAAGGAQQFAWVSGDLAARYPEFVYAPERATTESYACLFRSWLRDPAWLAEHRGIKASVARTTAQVVALAELCEVRRLCALVRLVRVPEAATDGSPSAARAAFYANALTEATGFRYTEATHLLDVSGEGEARHAAESLRACLFAAALDEHLRTRHGTRWWASRAAGDELIDLWNTGARYTVEELARLATSSGQLDAELLAVSLNSTLEHA